MQELPRRSHKQEILGAVGAANVASTALAAIQTFGCTPDLGHHAFTTAWLQFHRLEVAVTRYQLPQLCICQQSGFMSGHGLPGLPGNVCCTASALVSSLLCFYMLCAAVHGAVQITPVKGWPGVQAASAGPPVLQRSAVRGHACGPEPLREPGSAPAPAHGCHPPEPGQ